MVNHPHRKPSYPDHTLEDAARKAGVIVVPLWEMRGPPNTEVDWMVCYLINGRLVIVQTFAGENRWSAFTTNDSIEPQKTIDDVMARCGVPRALEPPL